MLVYKKNPSANCFAGNPVVFVLSSGSGESIGVSVDCGNVSVYEGVVLPAGSGGAYTASVDLSDILSTCFEDYAVDDPAAIVGEVARFAPSVSVRFVQGDSLLDYSGKIFRGGIPRQAIRLLEERGTDFFDFRLKNYSRNFLFTTRTNEREIYIRKTEIAPFVFIHPGSEIVFRTGGREIPTPAKAAGTVCAMNPATVLALCPDAERIEVFVNGEPAFKFLVEPEKPAPERYLFRFRNSLGCFEILEVTGRAENAPEFGEENLYDAMTPFLFFEGKRSRTETRDVTLVHSGYRRREEMPFLSDMIKSDEIYCETPQGDAFRCHVSCGEMKFPERITEPVSFSLTVKRVTTEEFVTPLIDGYAINWDKTFDETFVDAFD